LKKRPASAEPKRILILSAGFGDGHHAAAYGLAKVFERAGHEAKVMDVFRSAHPTLNELLRKGYRVAITHLPKIWRLIYRGSDAADFRKRRFDVFAPSARAMKSALEDFEPDALISTYPLYAHLIERLVGREGRLPFPFVSVVTDARSVNSIWYSSPSDHYTVIDKKTGIVLKDGGVPEKKIHVFGFPIDPEFEVDAPFVPNTPLKILFLPSTNKRRVREILRSLTHNPDLPSRHITTVLGRHHKRLSNTVADATSNAPPNVHHEVLGWTDRIPALLQGSHCVIGKAGGASVQESMAACCPLLLDYVVPGQEEGNAELAIEAGCAEMLGAPDQTGTQIANLLADDRARLNQMRKAGEHHGNPHAASEIADFVLSLTQQQS